MFEPLHRRFLLLDEVSSSRKEVDFILVCWICERGLTDQAECCLSASVLPGLCCRSRTLALAGETTGFVERVERCADRRPILLSGPPVPLAEHEDEPDR